MRALAAGIVLTVTSQAAVEPSALAQAAEYSGRHGQISLVVWQGGRTLVHHHAPLSPPPRIFSITKSLVSIGVFREVKTGGLSLAQPVRFDGARGVPLVDLLNQTSGLPSAHREFYSEGLENKEPVLRRLRRQNGGSFVYGPSHWEVLAEEIQRHRGSPLDRWLRKFVPGASNSVMTHWRRDNHGRLFFSTGARMEAGDLLPAGREVLQGMQRGRWPDEVRRLLATGTEANRMYALGFWLNHAAASSGAREINVEAALGRDHPPEFWRHGCLSRSAPPDLLAMIGTRGQRVYVVPSQDLVVIRQGVGPGFSDAEFLRRLFGS